MLTVTVNDRPIDVAAIVERGRVLLPMRATFTALGASVRYDPNGSVIIARSAAHALRLQLGSRDAIADGHHVTLEVPPRVIAARTYLPLRFVAQAMGAVVGYDARAKLVSVVARNTATSGAQLSGVDVIALSPSPQSIVASAYPTISASLGTASAAPGAVTLAIDGQDETPLASFDGTTITYMPRIGLQRGQHTVTFSGRTFGGDEFSATWSFDTSLEAPPDAPSMSTYDYRFYASGPIMYYPGDWMRFVLIAPPGGSAELQLCGLGYRYAMWNGGSGSVYEANFPAPNGYWISSCPVTATYVGWNGQRYFVPIPVVIGLYTRHNRAHPTPKPSAAPRPVPSSPRRPEPTPAPVHTLRPMPVATAQPQPTPRVHATPAPHPVPLPHPHPRRTP
jgi:Copper amine oxidase N-terminal domain